MILNKNIPVTFVMPLKRLTPPYDCIYPKAVPVQRDSILWPANVISCVPGRRPTTDGGILCPVCVKVFSNSYNLNIHVKTVHENQQRTTVNCSFCSKVFKNSNSLRKHVHTYHTFRYSKPAYVWQPTCALYSLVLRSFICACTYMHMHCMRLQVHMRIHVHIHMHTHPCPLTCWQNKTTTSKFAAAAAGEGHVVSKPL